MCHEIRLEMLIVKLENFRLRQDRNWHLIFRNWNFPQLLAMLFLYSNLVLINIFFSSHPHPYPYLFFPPLPSMLSFPRLFIFPLTSFPLLYLPSPYCIFLSFTGYPFLYCIFLPFTVYPFLSPVITYQRQYQGRQSIKSYFPRRSRSKTINLYNPNKSFENLELFDHMNGRITDRTT